MKKKIILLAQKKKMKTIFLNGYSIPVTELDFSSLEILKVEKQENKYKVIIGLIDRKKSKIKKPQQYLFKNFKQSKKFLTHFELKESYIDVNVEEFFSVKFLLKFLFEKRFCNVQGKRKGKGFCGVIKRFKFKGGPASHGSSLFHRRPGSIGTHGLARVVKGRKMPGRISVKNVSVLNIEIIKFDVEKKKMFVKGCLPGNFLSVVKVVILL